MIDSTNKHLRPLSHLARKIPNRRGSDGINVATLWRWSQSGARGIRLTTTMVGGIRMASESDIAQFFAATTAAANGEAAPIVSTKGRERAIREANEALDRAGI